MVKRVATNARIPHRQVESGCWYDYIQWKRYEELVFVELSAILVSLSDDVSTALLGTTNFFGYYYDPLDVAIFCFAKP